MSSSSQTGRVFLGAIIKNGSKFFSVFREFVGDLVNALPSIRIIVYEDGSEDNTPKLLEALHALHPVNVRVVSEKVEWSFRKSQVRTWDNKPCRIECIAAARNRLMELLEAEGLGENTTDKCIIVDPDMLIKPPVDRILFRLENYPESVDAVFANGISLTRNGMYYDHFAFRDFRFPFDRDVIGEKRSFEMVSAKGHLIGEPISFKPPFPASIPVWSAFGGMAIYKGAAIRGKRYSAFPTPALDAIYRAFINDNPEHPFVKLVKESQSDVKTHQDGCLLGLYPFEKRENGGLFYFNCHGYNVPIVCEHVTFHAEMVLSGSLGKMVVDPMLLYVCDHGVIFN